MENNVDTIIGVNVSIKGNLFNKGSIQVNGIVEGEVKSEENVIVGENAHIKGPVIAKKVEVSGEIKGTVEALEKLEINPTGRIIGDINVRSLIIKEGAVFVGKSIMSAKGASEATVETASGDSAEKTKESQSSKEPEKAEPAADPEDKLGFFSKK
jgi:cytoskeletal protein CcmA (bactofilin family)